jgi:diguanylate cyclase (GGDEF)-like protein
MQTGPLAAEEAALLRGVELFSSLLDDDLAYMASRVERLRVNAGAGIFAQGENASRFYIVVAGGATIFRRSPDGKEREVARYIPGDALGDFEFAVGADFSGSARADTNSTFLVFPGGGRSMADIAFERPDSAARLLLRSAAMVSSRLRSTQSLISHNAPWVRELRRQIYTDPGTGLWSKAYLDEELPRAIERPTAIILVKPDHFKELNDAHGHSAGDAAMERMAAMLNDQIERLGRGWALRLRSNETALVVPRCSAGQATEIARLLSSLVGAVDLSRAIPGCAFTFTASVTLAVWPDDGADWRRLVEEAYAILTRAWQDGGARIYRLKPRKEEAPA